MDEPKTSPVAVKRSLEPSPVDIKSGSSPKKSKPEIPSETSKDEVLQSSEAKKMGQLLKKNNPNAPAERESLGKRSALSPNVLKRSGDFLPETSPYRSPSKKRKTVAIRDELEHIEDNPYPFRDDMDKKRKRTRRKALLKAVLEQMEFYFGDCNLRKDRYMRKLYDDTGDGYVDLSVFSNFNKLQALSKDGVHADVICKALSKSKLLEVNESQTKVRRRVQLVEISQKEVDKRTVYVEYLPDHASHSWIQKIFSQCGKVCYVSLPKYQTTGEIKGFAFVEFSCGEEAEKACKMLNNPPPAKPEEKAGKFPKWNKMLKSLQKSAPPVKTEDPDSNEENMQVEDAKEELPAAPTKKKKKKKSKAKVEESGEKLSSSEPSGEKVSASEQSGERKMSGSEESGERKMSGSEESGERKMCASEQSDNPEERKKRKKKRRKATAVGEAGQAGDKGVKEGSEVDSVVKGEQGPKVSSDQEMAEGKTATVENETEPLTPKKRKKKKRKKRGLEMNEEQTTRGADHVMEKGEEEKTEESAQEGTDLETTMSDGETVKETKLCRKTRKQLRQADIRRRKSEGELMEGKDGSKDEKLPKSKMTSQSETEDKKSAITGDKRTRLDSLVSESSETESPSKVYIKSDGSQVTSILGKSRKLDVVKKVEFDPVPITTEFVERKEVRRRKKQKRDSLHLRVLSKKEWLGLRAEYIQHQKSHMAALKESLRALRMQEMGTQQQQQQQALRDNNGKKHVDLTSVFGTSRMKPSDDVKIAHVEELKFVPNVIVQWKCSHEINRNKIKTMFQEISSDRIAYIEGKEEAKSGYIRFKDEASAEEFARLSRNSDSFSARVLPESQQASYWEKANRDRLNKLSQKRKERGSDKIARKVFERNKATFLAKGSHVVFDDNDDDNNSDKDTKIEAASADSEPKKADSAAGVAEQDAMDS